jgi:hypothetical protein
MVNIAGKKLKLAIWDTGTATQPTKTPPSFSLSQGNNGIIKLLLVRAL